MQATITPEFVRLNGETNASFQKIRQQTLQELRQEMQRRDQRFALQLDARQRREKLRMESLAAAGLDLKQIEAADRYEVEELEELLATERPAVMRPLPNQQSIRSEKEREFLISQMGQPVELAGMDLLTGLRRTRTESDFEAAYRRTLKSSMSGDGWGCMVKENPDYPDTMAYWWHVYTPTQSRTFNFYISAPHSGFYVTRASDSWYNCKYVKTYCFYEMDVYQTSWRGVDRRTVLDRRGSNINTTGRMQGTTVWSFNHALQANLPVTVRVTITLDIYAQGSGSYGELNFADGSENYLDSPEVYIY